MKVIDTILRVLPILVLFAGFLRYLSSEISKRKERRVNQLLDLRSQIQNDADVSHVMFLCETNNLTSDFYSLENNETNNILYKEVVKTIGLFDTVCYAFILKNLDKDVFLYFFGEMQEIISNDAIQSYLDHLLVKNVKSMNDEHMDQDVLFDNICPYGYFQLCMRISSVKLSTASQRETAKLIQKEKAQMNEYLYNRFYLKQTKTEE